MSHRYLQGSLGQDRRDRSGAYLLGAWARRRGASEAVAERYGFRNPHEFYDHCNEGLPNDYVCNLYRSRAGRLDPLLNMGIESIAAIWTHQFHPLSTPLYHDY